MNTTTQNPTQSNPPVKSVLKLGLDVDLKQITVTLQSDHQHPKPALSFTPARLVAWVRERVQAEKGSVQIIFNFHLEPCRFRQRAIILALPIRNRSAIQPSVTIVSHPSHPPCDSTLNLRGTRSVPA